MLKPPSDLLILVMAVYMATKTYINDLGPGNIFLSSLMYFRDRSDRPFHRFAAEVLECPKCLSFWLSSVLLILRAVNRPLFLLASVPLSVSLIVHRVLSCGHDTREDV